MKKIIFLLSLVLIIIGVYFQNSTELNIPDTSIRLRVIPNSNNPKDINIKEKVKKYLESDIYVLLKDVADINTARNILSNNINKIENNIEKIFKDNNYNMKYNVNYGYNYFPEKEYKGQIYQEGEYESLVIYIGEAKGDNWWCVLFPNLCLIDTNEEYEYKSFIQELINKIF